jgi:hypothetical protein
VTGLREIEQLRGSRNVGFLRAANAVLRYASSVNQRGVTQLLATDVRMSLKASGPQSKSGFAARVVKPRRCPIPRSDARALRHRRAHKKGQQRPFLILPLTRF